MITLIREQGYSPEPPEPPFRLREAEFEDIPRLAAIDTAAFDAVWAYSASTIEAAFRQAASVSVIEEDSQMLGFQLSTWFTGHGHLARLAVLPEQQGRGLGQLLVGDAIRYFAERGVTTLSVNTQEDNLRSQRLYKRLGFKPASPNIPVWTITL